MSFEHGVKTRTASQAAMWRTTGLTSSWHADPFVHRKMKKIHEKQKIWETKNMIYAYLCNYVIYKYVCKYHDYSELDHVWSCHYCWKKTKGNLADSQSAAFFLFAGCVRSIVFWMYWRELETLSLCIIPPQQSYQICQNSGRWGCDAMSVNALGGLKPLNHHEWCIDES